MSNRVVHIVGVGTIGEPLAHLLLTHKQDLALDEVTFHKNSASSADRGKLKALIDAGAKLVCDENKRKDFQALGFKPSYITEESVSRASVVIDCCPKRVGLENKKTLYSKYDDGKHAFLAQGSEFGFGQMYAHGINDETLPKVDSRFLHIVSCNTHNISVMIKTIAGSPDGVGIENLEKGDFVCMRRASDVGNGESVSAPEVGEHKDKKFGTHHARDAYYLFKTKGLDLPIYSSAVKFNTQLMHTLWFHLRLSKPLTLDQIKQRVLENPELSITEKLSASAVFQVGRERGFRGRILNQAVVPLSTLQVSEDGMDAVGFCFTPQDGNSLVSSVAATAWFLHGADYLKYLKPLKLHYMPEV